MAQPVPGLNGKAFMAGTGDGGRAAGVAADVGSAAGMDVASDRTRLLLAVVFCARAANLAGQPRAGVRAAVDCAPRVRREFARPPIAVIAR